MMFSVVELNAMLKIKMLLEKGKSCSLHTSRILQKKYSQPLSRTNGLLYKLSKLIPHTAIKDINNANGLICLHNNFLFQRHDWSNRTIVDVT